MKIDELATEFGSGRKACLALGISDRNFSNWKKRGWIPQSQQLRIEKITSGKLIADEFGSDRKPISYQESKVDNKE